MESSKFSENQGNFTSEISGPRYSVFGEVNPEEKTEINQLSAVDLLGGFGWRREQKPETTIKEYDGNEIPKKNMNTLRSVLRNKAFLSFAPNKNKKIEGIITETNNQPNIDDMVEGDQHFVDAVDLEEKSSVTGKFYMKNQRLMLTYSTHINKEYLIATIKAAINRVSVSFIRCAHETGDSINPYDHTHVVLDVGNQFQTSCSRTFDVIVGNKIIHPNIKIIKSAIHFENCKRYLAKEDKENEDLAAGTPSLFAGIQNCESKEEALNKFVKRPGDVMGVSQAYDMRNTCGQVVDPNFLRLPWQTQLEREMKKTEQIKQTVPEIHEDDWDKVDIQELMNKQACSRIIRIVHDPVGHTGKTVYQHNMLAIDPKKYFLISRIAQARDMASIIQTGIRNGWSGNTLFINFAREDCEFKIYQVLENLRDGFMTVEKYQGGSVRFDIVHLVLFCNRMLDVTKMSQDRWVIHTINPGYLTLRNIDKELAIRVREYEERIRIEAANARRNMWGNAQMMGQEGTCFINNI